MHSWEPLESTLNAAWEIQAWGDHIRRQNGHLSLPVATESPLAAAETTPETSPDALPSSDETSIPPNPAWPSDDSEEFVSCIPIGVLGIHSDGYPAQDIALLVNHRWVRTSTHEAIGAIRLCVDPRMTHRMNQQKSYRKLRLALKGVMSKIDYSAEAWEGKRSPSQGIENDEDSQDESLWYIFNTLDDPSPNTGVVKDPWSRRAMEDLLSDEDYSDLGLKTRLYPYQRRSAALMVQREAQPAQMLDPRLQPWQTPTGSVYYYDKEDGVIFRDEALYSEACGGKFSYKWRIRYVVVNYV